MSILNYTFDLSHLSEQIKQKREAAGLTQRQLANLSGLSFSFVNRVENGDLNIQLNSLQKLLNVFGIVMTFSTKKN